MVEEGLCQLQKVLGAIKNKLLHLSILIWEEHASSTYGKQSGHVGLHHSTRHRRSNLDRGNVVNKTGFAGMFTTVQIKAMCIG
eukprot:Skav200198  [mRNA]  locus=scaffold623:101522:107048:+ [translate_table: standard]